MPVAARWGDRQHTADRLDPKLPLMLFNEGNHLPNRRSGSACAKYADAFLRIPLAWRSCLFPRSNAFSRARRSLVKPSRRRAHRRLGPLERTRRVACRVAAKLRRNRLVGRVVTVIPRPLLAKKTDPAFPQLRRVFRGDFFLSTGLSLREFYSPVNPGRFNLPALSFSTRPPVRSSRTQIAPFGLCSTSRIRLPHVKRSASFAVSSSSSTRISARLTRPPIKASPFQSANSEPE